MPLSSKAALVQAAHRTWQAVDKELLPFFYTLLSLRLVLEVAVQTCYDEWICSCLIYHSSTPTKEQELKSATTKEILFKNTFTDMGA